MDAEITIYNLVGQEIAHEEHYKNNIYSINLQMLVADYVIVKVKNKDKETSRKVFVG